MQTAEYEDTDPNTRETPRPAVYTTLWKEEEAYDLVQRQGDVYC